MKRLFKIVLSGIGVFVLALFLFPLPKDMLFPSSSQIVRSSSGGILRVFLSEDEMWRMHESLDRMSPHLKSAVLEYEDRYFYLHPGFNPVSIARAVLVNAKAKEFKQGGSTITMQLARMIEARPRTLRAKLIESFRTVQLELFYSKDEILERYLNLTPYGGNIVGVSAASYVYYGKSASNLTIAEASLLASIPNNPNFRRPDIYPERAKRARNSILDLIANAGLVDDDDILRAKEEEVPLRRIDLPFLAPHFSRMLRAQSPNTASLRSTLDLGLQVRTGQLLESYTSHMKKEGVRNAAMVVIENSTMKIRAWHGSLDFFDRGSEGQNDGVLASRSPGSTLKPFVYGLALDHGVASPGSMLEDVPADYNGYQPVNFDGGFSGLVSFEEALIRSLNVPAVNLDAALAQNGLHQFMVNAGVNSINQDKSHYGLSLVLGGGEISLIELATLYAGLANGGEFGNYRVLEHSAVSKYSKLLSEEASYYLSHTLAELTRPTMSAVWDWSQDRPKISWKTGTSYGHKDAWSIGYTKDYTIGVWVGNFDGSGSPALVGAEAAAPILMASFDAIGSETTWFEKPKTFDKRRVCSISGQTATDLCSSVRSLPFLAGVSPNKSCELHVRLEVDTQSGKRVCSECRVGRNTEFRVFERWPAKVATWMDRHDHVLGQIPEHAENCNRILAGETPIIKSPKENAVYKTSSEIPLEYQKISLQASVSNSTNKIFWFIDQELVHSGSPQDQVFIHAKPGRHIITLLDDSGRSSKTAYSVQSVDSVP